MAWDHRLHRPSDEEQAVIDQAQQFLAAQAGISVEDAASRIVLYARFQDLRLEEAAEEVLRGTVRLLTVQEDNRDREDNRPQPGPPDA